MSFMAFEVSLNGERKFTVGADNWKHISAILSGHYIDPSSFPTDSDTDSSHLENEPWSHVSLSATIAISGEDVEVADPEGQVHTESKSGSYPTAKISPGDVIQIRVIETDSADDPTWQEIGPNWSMGTMVRRKSDPS